MRILIATAEVAPIAKTGGLGDVCGSLPKALAALGHEVVVFMPYYRQAREWFEANGVVPEVAVPTTQVIWANWSAESTVLQTTLPESDVPLYLIANDYFFDRQQIYGPRDDGFDDFLLRYTFFSRAIINACGTLGIAPDILHAHDWHTALMPVYLDSGLRGNPSFRETRSVYTIHNLNYQGVAAAGAFPITGLHSRYWRPDAIEHWGQVNPMKAGILFADQVTTVSPNYAREIQTPALGAGLDGILRSLSFKLTGVLNGIDVEHWDPATDPHLRSTYDAERPAGKNLCKRDLLREAKLRYRPKNPVMAVVSRMVDQKGFQLLIPVLERLLRIGAQAVVLGSGDPRFEDGFRAIEEANPESCRVWIGFDNALAHRIYGGADILLMPSIYEPCGLNQMYALRYGTLPVVRLTGGLVDTVHPFDGSNNGVANGFGFTTATSEDLFAAAWLSILTYRDSKLWKRLQRNGIAADFSWDRSAHDYENVYRRARAA
jgi:starch synthase